MKEIQLTRGKTALVDDADYEALALFSWQASNHGKTSYAIRAQSKGGKKCLIYMHRSILVCDGPVDHIDGNKLNNQRANLRPASAAENIQNRGLTAQNRSGLKGAWFVARAGLWTSQVTAFNKRYYLGYFNTKEEAHAAYCAAITVLHGEFARYK